MEASCSLRSSKFISTPIRPLHHPLSIASTISISVIRDPNFGSSLRLVRRKNRLSIRVSSSDTLVAGSREVVSKKEEDLGDLKSWMHKNGLPPCKVILKEKPSHNEKHRPIHYVAASEDLQVKFCSCVLFWFLELGFMIYFSLWNRRVMRRSRCQIRW